MKNPHVRTGVARLGARVGSALTKDRVVAVVAGLMVSCVVAAGGCGSSSSNPGAPGDAGNSGSAGTGATGGGGAGGVAGRAARGELIHGDATACPAQVPTPASSCAGSARCTYQGGVFGLSYTDDPLTCDCASVWICVGTDAEGRTSCPIEYPPATACQSAITCLYATPLAIADCRCTGAGGSGGGAERWTCGL